jgi:acyl carrier protein
MFEQVTAVIAETLHVSRESITRETCFVEDLGADSLDMYRLWLALEDAYDAELRPAEDMKIRTVGELCDRLRKSLSEDI